MSFNNLILSQVNKVAGGAFDLNIAVENQKDQLISSVSSTITNEVPIPLPVDVESVVKGDLILPSEFLTPDYINNFVSVSDVVQFLSESQKEDINNTLDKVESVINTTVQTTNQLTSALNLLQTPISTLSTLATTLDSITTALNISVTTIKSLPAPSSTPPGIGVPLGVINTLSDGLDTLGDIIKAIDGPVQSVSEFTTQLNSILFPISQTLNEVNSTIEPSLQIISFIRLLLEAPVTQEQINKTITDSVQSVTDSLAEVGQFSNPEANQLSEQALIDSFPFIYEEYELTLEYNSDNQFEFPQRRIKGTNIINNQILYNQEDGSYSFSSSVQILVDEIKFRIDLSKQS